MSLSSQVPAQFGTLRRRLGAGALALLLASCAGLLACTSEPRAPERDAESEDPPDADEADASIDASRTDTDAGLSDGGADLMVDAGSEYSCLQHSSEIKTFVENHRSCSSNDDCVLVGDCSHSNFQVVARSAEEGAKKLVFDDRCRYNDGPGYFARCRESRCERIKSRVWCGGAPQSECPTGMVMHKTLCGAVDPKSYHSGCYTPCSAQGDDGPCTSGYTCQKTTIDPCPATPGEGEKWLCAPVAACQVELSLTFDGRSAVRVLDDEATELKLWLENRTDQALTFSYELPCNGPAVVGLADYDLWGACLAGACPSPRERVEVTLAPREKRLYRSALVELAPSTCNMHGLAAGKYSPTFGLPYVQGANVCGPEGTSLTAGSATP